MKTLVVVTLIAALAGCATGPTGMPDVVFIPTHELIAIEMLKLAGVTKDDVVYDLGSGDGRIVIAAAREFGARGVGVELDGKLVGESRHNAIKAGVADRTEFVWQNIFQADIKPATVVTMYLLPDVNLRLRPKLHAELRPGARIVSHDFDMGDWKPERTVRVKGPSREHTLFLWIVPPR